MHVRLYKKSPRAHSSQIQDKAKEILGIYARLLEGRQFVYKGL